MADRRPRLRWLVVALAALATVAGCAEVPVSGPLQSTKLPAAVGGQQQGTLCCAQIMGPPRPGWSPSLIVQNFILASADFADHHAIARQYLTADASSSWRPGPGPAVTVIAGPPNASVELPPQLNSPKSETVEITAKELGAVNATGQYIPAPDGQKPLTQHFGLKLVGHQWRIDGLPGSGQVSRELLLSKDFFQLAYQPRNLYYFDPAYKNLVPDPVFLPINTADPATVLVNALLAEPQGWLEGAAYSAFPAGSRSVRVQIPPGSKTAIVDLSMPKTAATRSALAEMSAQLVWTLTSTSYGSHTIQAVKLEVNGRAWTPPGSGSAVQDRTDYPQPCLQPTSGHQSVYFLTAGGTARVLPSGSRTSQAVPGQAGTGQVPLSSIAVSPDQHYLAGTGPLAGGTVYVSDLAAAAQPHASQSARALHVRITGMKVSAASWDQQDNLWVAGSIHGRLAVRVLPGSSGPPDVVTLPPGIQQITAFRVAPDGVRVALIVSTRAGPRVLLAAVVHSGDQVTLASAGQLGADLAQPTSLSWYDADHLLVLDQADVGPQLFEVPVNGDRSTFQSIEPGMISITAAGPQNDLFASLSDRSAGPVGRPRRAVAPAAGRPGRHLPGLDRPRFPPGCRGSSRCGICPGAGTWARRQSGLLTTCPGQASVVIWHPSGSVVAPCGVPRQRGARPGKPMPAAGETAHVRRLVVDRSRCGLEVSPAPPGDQMSPGPGEGPSWQQARESLSRRMWGRRPGRPGGCHPHRGSKGVSHVDIIFRGRRTGVPERFRDYATAKLGKIVKLDQKTISIDVEITLERNPRQSAQRERVELTVYSRGPVIRAEAAADDRFQALDKAAAKLETHMRRASDRRKPRKPAHGVPADPALDGAADGCPGAGPGGRDTAAWTTGPTPKYSSTAWCRSRWKETARWSCGRSSTTRRR